MNVNVMTSIAKYGVVHKRRKQVSKREKTHGKCSLIVALITGWHVSTHESLATLTLTLTLTLTEFYLPLPHSAKLYSSQ